MGNTAEGFPEIDVRTSSAMHGVYSRHRADDGSPCPRCPCRISRALQRVVDGGVVRFDGRLYVASALRNKEYAASHLSIRDAEAFVNDVTLKPRWEAADERGDLAHQGCVVAEALLTSVHTSYPGQAAHATVTVSTAADGPARVVLHAGPAPQGPPAADTIVFDLAAVTASGDQTRPAAVATVADLPPATVRGARRHHTPTSVSG